MYHVKTPHEFLIMKNRLLLFSFGHLKVAHIGKTVFFLSRLLSARLSVMLTPVPFNFDLLAKFGVTFG